MVEEEGVVGGDHLRASGEASGDFESGVADQRQWRAQCVEHVLLSDRVSPLGTGESTLPSLLVGLRPRIERGTGLGHFDFPGLTKPVCSFVGVESAG